ncbi:unnamed protein product [Closterium sp. NIES-65]|nr:unnamed protein product [Closterium sp. NIES-65]
MGEDAERPRWFELLRVGVDIFVLDYDAIISTMYALEISADGDCYLCVLPDPGIEASTLGAGEAATLVASESALSSTTPDEALHTFTLHSGAFRCFFRDSTALTPLLAPVAVTLADPSGGPVLARSTTVLRCPAVPSGSLSGLHLPSFSTNLVSNAVIQDHWVDTFSPGGQRVAICTCSMTGRHLATFARQPGSSLYTPTTVSPQVAAIGQVSASGQVASPCERRSLSHQTLLWHHRLGHPSLPRLRGMHRRLLVSGLPRSLPPLPASPAPPYLPCVEGRQHSAPHSSSFPPTEAPLQTLHLDVWGLARVRGQGGERYFLLVVDDYSHYTTIFPLRTKGEVPAVQIPWIRAVRLRLRRRFRQDLPILRLHSDRGGEFSSDLLRAFYQGEGMKQSFTLLGSVQQNGFAERRIGLVVGDASHFRVWGARALMRDTSADKLSSRTIPCVFLGFVPDAPGWQFYHPTSRRVFPSQDVTFDESVHFYHLFPYRTAPLPPPPLFLTAGPPPIDPLPPRSPAPWGVSQVLRSAEPWGAGLAVAESRGAESVREVLGGAEPGGAEPTSAEPGGAEPEGAGSGGAESVGIPLSLVSRRGPVSPQQAREWLASRTRQRSRAAGAACRGGAGSAGVSGPGGARTGGTGAAGTGTAPRAGGVGFGGAAAGCTRAGGPGAGAVDPGINDPVAGGAGSGGVDSGGAGAGGFGAAGGAGAGGADAVVTGAGGAATGGVGAGGSGAAGGAGAGGAAVGVTGAGGAAAGGAGAGGSGAAGGAGVGGVAAGVTRAGGAATRGAGAGDSGAAGGARARGAATGVTGARGAAAGGSGAAEGSGAAGGAGATGTGGTAPPRLFLAPLSPSSLPPRVYVLRQVLSLPSSTGLPLKSGAPLPAPSPYTEQTNSLTERREPPSRPASPVRARRTDSRVPPERPPPVPGTRAMALRPSSVLQRVPLPSPPASSLPDVQNP